MLTAFDPQSLATRWNTSAESVIALIRSGKLRAFTLSPAGSKRPRWKVSPDAVTEFESGRINRAAETAPLRRRRQTGVIEFY